MTDAPRGAASEIAEILSRLGGLVLAALCVAGSAMIFVPSGVDFAHGPNAEIFRLSLLARATVAALLLAFPAAVAAISGLGPSSALAGPLSAAAARRMATATSGIVLLVVEIPWLAFSWVAWRDTGAGGSFFGVDDSPASLVNVREALVRSLLRVGVAIVLVVGPWRYLARRRKGEPPRGRDPLG